MKTAQIFSLAFLLFALAGCGSNTSENPVPDVETGLTPLTLSDNCILYGKDNEIEILSWNWENFPQKDELTVERLAELVKAAGADIIAVQEIKTKAPFAELAEKLPGYKLFYGGGGLAVGYVVKMDKVQILEEPFEIYPSESSAFPRRPYVLRARFGGKTDLTLVNLHLKCCDGETNENRRRLASELLKKYADENWASENLLIVGDFNDLIIEKDPDDNVFANFIFDEKNYRFADTEIAAGPSSEWSYPSWPSQIDHILISNELFDNVLECKTLKIGDCYPDYAAEVSDHRPVALRLSAD